ncbi:PLP-dependent aminotransferase family protein [Oceanisphaera sp. KMM 10153]|uniref:aminotransferase-like domain-containing protein n=1 Tax=Oceanisphaera submarina TaxID=3390193 RepID=UPI003976FDF4
MAKYRQLAEKFIDDIRAGKLAVGDRLLSLRQFARQHGVSLSTAVSCYAELESLGWLVARPKAGFFVAPKRLVVGHPEWKPFESRVAVLSGQHCHASALNGPLGTSRLFLEETSQRALESSFRRAMKRAAAGLSRYPAPQGEAALRAALAGHFGQCGFALDDDELVITHGCMDAVKTVLEVCTRPGDAVAISSPCYNGLLEVLSQLSLRIVEIPSLEEGIDLDQLEHHLRLGTVQAGLFCTTHMNPQGLTMSMAQKQRLAQLANRYRVPMIEDDVYLELAHHQHVPLPAAYHDEGGFVIWCGSVSKSLSPSYRLGWCRPGRYFQPVVQRALGVPTLMQLALADFIEVGAYARHLKRTRYRLAEHKRHYLDYLARYLPVGSRISQPDGGLVLWIQIPGLDAGALGTAAELAGLDIRVGGLFTASDRYRDCLRINIGFPFDESVQRELQTLIKLVGMTPPPRE